MSEEINLSGVDASASAIEVVYQILREAGESLDYREILDRVVAFKEIVSDDLAKAMSHIYTEINLDPRFVYIGSGAWGLREWVPKTQVGRSVSAQTIAQRSRQPERWHEEGSLDEPDAPRRPDEDDDDWSPEPG